MPFQLDQEALDSPNMKILDINKPPTKSIGYQAFPQMLYLHPKDKSKEHRTTVVQSAEEMNEAMDIGWRKEPHVPIAPPEELSKNYEGFEVSRPSALISTVEPPSLEDMTKAELIAVAKERNIGVDQQSKKEVILSAIMAASPA